MFSRSTSHAIAATTVAIAALVACAACGDTAQSLANAGRVQVVDDAGDTIRLEAPAKRIISLIPSATETLIALGVRDRIVGRTRYDVAPDLASIPSVGGGLDPSVEAIVALKPDLVIGWDNDKRRAIRTKLSTLGIQVLSLRTQDTSDVFRGIKNLGAAVGRDSSARSLAQSIRATLDSVRKEVAGRPVRRVMFVVYPDPVMTVGPHTFIDELIGVAGGSSVFNDLTELWPRVSMEEVVKRAPELLIVPQGEFKENAVEQFRARNGWRDLGAVRSGSIATVAADLVQRPGANIGVGARALEAAIHPELRGAK